MKLTAFKTYFQQDLKGIYTQEEILHFFYVLVEDFLHEDRFFWVIQSEFELSESQLNFFENALSDLKLFRPIQYIVNQAHFGHLNLQVSEGVLIPRPETLELVEWIADFAKERSGSVEILDIGTGSGCIAISLSKAIDKAYLTAMDVSEAALEIAKNNAQQHQQPIEFIHANVLELSELPHSFDIIVSNPPYVRELEKKMMSKNVLEHEPETALFVTDEDPLLFYRKIAELAKESLRKGGALFFEINEYLGQETLSLLSQVGFQECELKKDIFGKDRMIKAMI